MMSIPTPVMVRSVLIIGMTARNRGMSMAAIISFIVKAMIHRKVINGIIALRMMIVLMDLHAATIQVLAIVFVNKIVINLSI